MFGGRRGKGDSLGDFGGRGILGFLRFSRLMLGSRCFLYSAGVGEKFLVLLVFGGEI